MSHLVNLLVWLFFRRQVDAMNAYQRKLFNLPEKRK